MKFEGVKEALFAGADVRRSAWPVGMFWCEDTGDTALVVPSDLKEDDWEVHIRLPVITAKLLEEVQGTARWLDLDKVLSSKNAIVSLIVK